MSVLSGEREYERLPVYICVVGEPRPREREAPLRLAAAPSDDGKAHSLHSFDFI